MKGLFIKIVKLVMQTEWLRFKNYDYSAEGTAF